MYSKFFIFIIVFLFKINIFAISFSFFKGAEKIENEIKALNNEQKEIKDALKNIDVKLQDLKFLSDIKVGLNDNVLKNKVNELKNSIQKIDEKMDIEFNGLNKSIKQTAGRDMVNINNESKLIRNIFILIISNLIFIILFLLRDNIRQRKEFQKYVEKKDLDEQYFQNTIERLLNSKNFYKEKLLAKLPYYEAIEILKEKRVEYNENREN